MQKIKIDGITYVIPSVPFQQRAVCSAGGGSFVDCVDSKTTSLILSLVTFRSTVQTFPLHYINEQFIEVWWFPPPVNSSTCLTTFLLHRESMDRFLRAVAVAEVKMVEEDSTFIQHLLKFTFLEKTSKYGKYFVVSTELLSIDDDKELKSLLLHSSEFAQLCINPRLNRNPALESVEAKILPSLDDDEPF